MNHSPSPNLMSPSGHINNRSLLSPDPHDSNSNHSGQFAAGESTPTTTTEHDNHVVPKKKNFKTEYKSKFTPFDQYVYNEVTDSFVKHSIEPNITINQNRGVSSSKSNQDIAGTDSNHPVVSISTQGADVFNPTEGIISDNHANNEPWYKEVVKRNEKANEYRFKSEIGHNSPLLNYNSSNNASSNLRAESPYNVERQIVSPNGTESISIGGDLLTTSDTRSQSSDPQNESVSLQQETKQQFKFTPSDYYKRDHLISHMANNNNFALPKEQSEHSTNNQKFNSRQNQVSSSARPASRAGAQVRSRSQSTRRQPASTTPSSTVSSKCQPNAKSNQTTPTRTVASRTTNRSQITSSAQTTVTKSPVKNTPLSSRVSSTRPTTASSRTATNLKTTPKEPVKRSPVLSNPVSKTNTPRSTNGTGTLGSRTTPSSAGIKKTATPTTRVTSVSKPTTLRPTNTSAISAGRLPKTNVSAPSTRTPALSSKNKNVEATKSPANSAAPTNAIKSIKTPKAIAAAKQAGVAAASATASAALVTASALAPDSVSEQVSDDHSDHVVADTSSKPAPDQASSNEPKILADQDQTTSSISPPEMPILSTEGQNQIFSQKETGNMLSDELAQAERESTGKFETESSEQQVDSTEKKTDYDFDRQNSNEAEKVNELLNSNELFNGLAGGLVSAEDRFDSSEKEISSELSSNIRQLSSDNDLYDRHDADEPYSIMPTTLHPMEADKQLFDDLGTSSDAHQDKGSDPENLNKNVQLEQEPQNAVDMRASEKDESVAIIPDQPKTYDVNDRRKSQSSASLSSKGSSGETDNLQLSELKPDEERTELFEEHENRSEADRGEEARLESTFDRFNLQSEKSSEPNEDQEKSLLPNETRLDRESNDNSDGNDANIKYESQNDNLSEEIVNTSDNEKKFVENNNTIGEIVDRDFPALVEDDEQKESSSPKKLNSTEPPQKSGDGENYDDLKESDYLIESTPALTSANTTLVEDFNTSANVESNSIAEVQFDNNDSKNTNTNLVHEALDGVKNNSLDDIANKQTQHYELAELQQSESKNAVDIDSDELEANTNRNELLMNVSDLIESESKKKLEMARKSEIARKNLSPQPPLPQSEILLSADQLTEQSNELPNESIEHESDMQVSELRQHDFETEEMRLRDNESDSSEKSSLIIGNIPANSTNLESSTSKNEDSDIKESVGNGDQLEETSDKEEDDNSRSEKFIVSAFKKVDTKEMNVNSVSEGLSEFNINDDIDNDEQLKLSNPLTNSDDELILQPRNYNYSSPRYNEGVGLEMMAQEEDRLNGSVELGDGSSAAIELPTVAENRIEMSASKSIVPEISQTNYLFSRTEDSDEELVDVLDSEKDLIDVEATIGHTTNVDKDELLRFNEVKEKVLENSKPDDTNDAQVQEIISASSVERGLDELNRNFSILAEPTKVTTDVIDDTVKQLQEHGELYRQLNKSQEERRLSTALEEHVLKRQHSSNSSTSSSAPSEKVQSDDGKHDELITSGPEADLINPKSENNNTTLSSDTNLQDESVQRGQIESETAKAATLLD